MSTGAKQLSPQRLSAIRSRLLARIHRRFDTKTDTHPIGPLRLAFTRVADPDVVLDQVVQAEDRREKLTGRRRDGNELHLPYWAELWDSALGLGACLAEAKDSRIGSLRPRAGGLGGLSILDLGCGMGFAGMVAAAMGARVLLADLESDALLFARLNTLPWSARIRTRRLNWQTDRLNESFDVILGADVLYDRTQWDHLEPFFAAHLRKQGSVLLGEPGRQTGDLFPDWITARGWALEFIEKQITSRPRPIRIFRMWRQDR